MFFGWKNVVYSQSRRLSTSDTLKWSFELTDFQELIADLCLFVKRTLLNHPEPIHDDRQVKDAITQYGHLLVYPRETCPCQI